MNLPDMHATVPELKRTRERIRWAYFLGSLIVFTILVIGSFTTIQHTENVLQARMWLLHTYEVIVEIDSLSTRIYDAAMTASGPEREKFAEKWEQTQLEAHGSWNDLARMTADNDHQQQRLKKLKPVLQNALTKLPATGEHAFYSHARKAMDVLSEMKAEEKALLDGRYSDLKAKTDALKATQNALFIAVILAFLLMLAVLNRLSKRQRHEERLQQIVNSVSAVLANRDDPDVLKRALEAVGDCLDAVAGTLFLEAEDKSLHCRAFWKRHGAQVDEFEKETRASIFQSGQGLPGRVYDTTRVHWVPEVSKDNNFLRRVSAVAGNLRGGIAFPIMSADGPIGVFEFFFNKSVPIDMQSFHTLYAVGLQLGQHIDRKRADQQLKDSLRKLDAIFNQTFEFIGLLSPDGILLDGNKTAMEFAGVDPKTVLGKPFWETPWWTHSAELQQKIKDAIRDANNGQLVRFEATHKDKNGKTAYVDFSLKPIFDESGNVVFLLPEGRDISEKKEAEKRISEFYSVVSHELRTPLTSIRGAFGLLEGGKGGDLSARAKHLVIMGRTESERLVRLINDILDIRKIEAGKFELNLSPVRPESLIHTTASALNTYADEAEVKLSIKCEDNSDLMMDIDRITQVLTNLISNAVKFSPKKSTVTIGTTAANHAVRFYVRDQGTGIKPQDQERLFKMFQQLDSSDTREKGGTGLGLAISKAIIEQHGGVIGVNSTHGEGATFWFEIPVTDATVVRNRVSGLTGQYRALPGARMLPPLVKALLVEDDVATRVLIKQHLSSLDTKFEFYEASDGDEAFALVMEHKPMLIILDVTLGAFNGFDFVEALKAEGLGGECPLIVYTASDLTSEEKQRLKLGPTRHLTKSLTGENEFLQSVTDLLVGSALQGSTGS